MVKDTELQVGVIGRPHGVRGAMRLWLHNANSNLISEIGHLTAESADGSVRERWTIRSNAPGPKGSRIIAVPEIEGREAAAAHTGWKLVVEKSRLPRLDDEEFYYYEAVGWVVETASGSPVGTIRQVVETSVDVLVIDRTGGGEVLLPVLKDVVLELDRAAARVRVADDAVERFE